jgi:hypothetical protein
MLGAWQMQLVLANIGLIVQYCDGTFNLPDWSDKLCNFYHILLA